MPIFKFNTPKKSCKNVVDAPYNPTANVHLTNVVSFVGFLPQHVLDILVVCLVNLFYPNLVYPTSNYSFACYALRKCPLKPVMIILALINYLRNIHIMFCLIILLVQNLLFTIAQISTAFTVPFAISKISNSCLPTSVIIPLHTD